MSLHRVSLPPTLASYRLWAPPAGRSVRRAGASHRRLCPVKGGYPWTQGVPTRCPPRLVSSSAPIVRQGAQPPALHFTTQATSPSTPCSTAESIASRTSSSSSVPGRASSVPSGSTGSTSEGALQYLRRTEVDRAIGLDVVGLGDRLRGVAQVCGRRVDPDAAGEHRRPGAAIPARGDARVLQSGQHQELPEGAPEVVLAQRAAVAAVGKDRPVPFLGGIGAIRRRITRAANPAPAPA